MTPLENAASAWDKPFPPGFTVAPAWEAHQRQNRQKIAAFRSAAEAIAFAQDGSQTGFDHRIEDRRFAELVSRWKLHEIERAFGLPDWAGESEHSSGFDIDGRRVSSIFLTHLYYFLQIRRLAPAARTFIEIGSGYGALARLFRLGLPDCRYILVDLPESLYFAEVFLRENFPGARIAYGMGDDYDFLLLPVQALDALPKADVAINTGSFQEMTEEANRFWMKVIADKCEALYSFNYFLLNRARHGETQNVTPICPVLDSSWVPQHFKINPPIPTIDATQRNWLEIFVTRGSGDAASYFERARSFPLATDGWFENIVMAMWCDPKPEYAGAFRRGCDAFRRGLAFNIANYRRRPRWNETPVGAWLAGNLDYLAGRSRPADYIDYTTGRHVGQDVGFLRHNYYFLRALRKRLKGWRRQADITTYSEETYFRG